MTVRCQKLPVIVDSRGVVFEPIDPSSFPRQRNVHVVISEPGVVRGNHYHLRGEETLVATGPALVRFREDGVLREIQVQARDAYLFVFPPGVPHAIKNLGEGANVLIAFNTVEHDPQRP
ncbi:MAG: WxcM-like domain-containing protein, partial [Deltaproteobacteria bacterium]|nr:WxcM-like domain-containing protein [Deltaproteobacteria bacterium]